MKSVNLDSENPEITDLFHVFSTETLARQVDSSGDVVFVPAFSGLYAPHWCNDARGTICGMTLRTSKAHIAYAALEAVCFQTKEV